MSATLHDSASQSGSHCWVERRLFEVLGAWSRDTPVPAATVALDRLAQHAAWRAGEWWERLPVLAQVDRDELVRPGPRWAFLAGEPTWWPDGGDDRAAVAAGRLAVVARLLLPRLASDYARQAAGLQPASDGAVGRTLAQVAADVTADWLAATVALDDLGEAPAVLERAEAAVAAGGRAAAAGAGPGSDPPRLP